MVVLNRRLALLLGHITVARDGLSMQHLEDLLSTDEDVLHSVYQWWGVGRRGKLHAHSVRSTSTFTEWW